MSGKGKGRGKKVATAVQVVEKDPLEIPADSKPATSPKAATKRKAGKKDEPTVELVSPPKKSKTSPEKVAAVSPKASPKAAPKVAAKKTTVKAAAATNGTKRSARGRGLPAENHEEVAPVKKGRGAVAKKVEAAPEPEPPAKPAGKGKKAAAPAPKASPKKAEPAPSSPKKAAVSPARKPAAKSPKKGGKKGKSGTKHPLNINIINILHKKKSTSRPVKTAAALKEVPKDEQKEAEEVQVKKEIVPKVSTSIIATTTVKAKKAKKSAPSSKTTKVDVAEQVAEIIQSDLPDEAETSKFKPKKVPKETKPAQLKKRKPSKAEEELSNEDKDDDEIPTSKATTTVKAKKVKKSAPNSKTTKEDVAEIIQSDLPDEAGTSKSKAKKVVKESKTAQPKKRKPSKAKEELSNEDKDDDEKQVVPVKKSRKAPSKTTTNASAPAAAPRANKVENDYSTFTLDSSKESNLKIATWNVAGLRAWVNKGGLDYIHNEKPDIICLQEIKCTENLIPDEAKSIKGYHPYWLSKPGGQAGVAIYSKLMPYSIKMGLDDTELDDQGRLLTAEYEKYFLVCVYVPNAGRQLVTLPKRLRWDEKFQCYLKELDAKKPVIVCGDMNVSHLEIDLANPKANRRNAGFTQEERDGMSKMLSMGFVDVFRYFYPDQEKAYTYWTYMMNCRAKNVGWRLDYFIVSRRFMKNVVDTVIRKEILGSDHCPLVLLLNL